jgi:hypothetical protein
VVDRYLVRIAEAADAGQPVPWLKIFTPALMVTGHPAPQRDFAEEFEEADALHIYGKTMPTRTLGSKAKAKDERAWSDAQLSAADRAKPVHAAASDGAALDAVCLTNATGIFPDGTKVLFECVRVPFTAISAWTTGEQQVLEKPSGGGWFFGGGLPLSGAD